ncbi:MAG: hypothetical protein RSF92_00385 [Niameybacter sp.]|uniref:hypothetical protein n=1 Tax=Niameybacter sp. TaxID=2033640 RepID=UPI002FCAF942
MRKREKFLDWFMGVGSGIMLSGLVMDYVGLNIRPQEVMQETVAKDEVEPTKPPIVVTIVRHKSVSSENQKAL